MGFNLEISGVGVELEEVTEDEKEEGCDMWLPITASLACGRVMLPGFPHRGRSFSWGTLTGVLRLPALPGGQRDVGVSLGTLTGALDPMTLPAG